MVGKKNTETPRRSSTALAFAVLVLTAVGHAPASAQNLETLEERAFRAAVEKVAPCVVQIETVGGREQLGEMLVGTGPTSGLIVGAEGYVVSSSINFAHAPSGIVVRLPSGPRLAATPLGTDHHRKIILLKIDPEEPLPVADFADPAAVQVGQWAIAVGRAFDPQQPNMAVGIVSALDRVWGKALQTDAAVSPNNYGGPLVDLDGRVLGILVPMSPDSDEEIAGMEWYDSGIGFAVPGADLPKIIDRLKLGRDLRPGLLGVTLDSASLMTAAPVVAGVHPNSPADRAGLRSGDRIIEIAGSPIDRSADMKRALAQHYADDALELVVRRDGQAVALRATLVAQLQPYECSFVGILPARESPADADGIAQGVKVRFVFPESPAQKAGLVEGDLITSIDAEATPGAAELRAAVARREPGEEVVLVVISGADRRTLKLTLGPAWSSIPDSVPAPTTDPDGRRGETVSLRLPEWPNEATAYLPKGYRPETPHGLLLWLRAPGGAADASRGHLWRLHADARQFIVVAPEPSSAERWIGREAEMAQSLLRLAMKRFSIDPQRVAVGGQQAGGTLAYRLVLLERDTIRGLVAIDALLAGPPLRDDPANRVSVLVGNSEKGPYADPISRSITALRQLKVPLAVLPRGAEPAPVNDREAAEIALWLDCLDRI